VLLPIKTATQYKSALQLRTNYVNITDQFVRTQTDKKLTVFEAWG